MNVNNNSSAQIIGSEFKKIKIDDEKNILTKVDTTKQNTANQSIIKSSQINNTFKGQYKESGYDDDGPKDLGTWKFSLSNDKDTSFVLTSNNHTFVGHYNNGQGNCKITFANKVPRHIGIYKNLSANYRVTYVGSFINDQPHGNGTMTYIDGGKYEGEWEHGKCKGIGKYTYSSENNAFNEDTYEGSFEDDNFNGYGIMTYKYGVMYKGYWNKGYCAVGTYILATDGNTRVDKMPKEFQEIIYANRHKCDKYAGGWKDKQFEGKGTMFYANGDKYVGEWKNGKREGRGTLIYAHGGGEYSGGFKDDDFDGKGLLTLSNGEIKRGTFENGFLQEGQVKKIYGNNEIYEGGSKNDKRNGFGTLTFENGSVYSGIWVNDESEGYESFRKMNMPG
jgi:hypothetical protein